MMRCDEVSNAEGSFGGCGVERRRERGGGAMKLARWMDGTRLDATRLDSTGLGVGVGVGLGRGDGVFGMRETMRRE